MFAKLKGAVAEKKAEFQEKKQNKWLAEVNPSGSEYLGLQGWKDLYEPKKEKKAGDGSSGSGNALQQKAMESLVVRLTTKVMRALTEVVARPIDVAATQVRGKDEQLSQLLNLLEAIVLSYRFAYKDASKFAWIRSSAVDSLALLLVRMTDAEAVRAGLDTEKLSAEQAQKLVDVIAARVDAELTARSAQMTEALEASPLFAAAKGQAAAAASQASAAGASAVADKTGVQVAVPVVDVDAGVGMLLGHVRGMVAGKLSNVTAKLTGAIRILGAIVAKHRAAVLAVAAAHASAGADPDAMPDAYKTGVKSELLAAVEGQYAEMEGAVRAFVRGFVMSMDDGDDE